MDRKNVIGITSVMALVATLWYILVPAEAPTVTASSRAGLPAKADGVTLVAPVGPNDLAAVSTAKPEEDGKGWFPTDTMSTVSARYHAMRDKRRFVDLAMKTGGGAYLAFFILVDRQCSSVGGKPGFVAAHRRRLEGIENPTVAQRANARRFDGCEGFEARPIGESDFLPLMTTYYGASDPAARALRLMREQDPERVRREAGALLGEGDPVLVALVADSIVNIVLTPDADGSAGGAPTSARKATYREKLEEDGAWTLALCRLGIECRKEGSVPWDEACLQYGHCSEDFYESLMRANHKSRFDAVLLRSQTVEKAIRDRNWRSLGF